MKSVPNCRFCGTPLTASLVDLGETPLANSYVTDLEAPKERRFALHARVCPSCLLVQVDDSVPPDSIFSDYAYFSSYSDSWVDHARRFTEAMITRFALGEDSLVVEIATNDGYLLQHFLKQGVPVLGIEPASNVAKAAIAKGIPTEIAFFNTATAKRLVSAGKMADLTVANNVLAHVPDIRDFLAGFAILLKPEGVATFEFPHVLNLIREVQFDTIYHEHFSYLSLLTVERVFAAAGLKAFHVEEISTHGGSLRLYAAKQNSLRIPSDELKELRAKERAAGLDQLAGYTGYAEHVKAVKSKLLGFLKEAKAAGKKVAAYGAAAKGNTLLNYCGVTQDDIVCVFDRSSAKVGKRLPGSHIPILSPENLATVKPDYLIILPWNIADEIKSSASDLASWGGQFVVAIPELRILP